MRGRCRAVSLSALALADAPVPAQFEVVQRYATLLSEGGKWALRSMLASDMVFAELDLFWREERGTEAQRRVWALVDAGVRLAVELDALVAEPLVGHWVTPGLGTVFRLTADGSDRMAYRRDELDHAPLDSAVVAIEGGVATSVSDEAAQVCRPGDVGLSHVRFTGPDHVTFSTIEDMCARRGTRPTWELVRLPD